MRVAVLLGAGASFDAGLKTTYGLAQDLMEKINSESARHHVGVREALNFVYGEMAAHRGAHGDNPVDAVNTERLISAVRLLANRDNHEADPFVASWKSAPGVSRATASLSGSDLSFAFSREQDPFDRPVDTSRLARSIRRITSDRHDEVFAHLENALLQTVSEVLSDHGDVGYLQPLLDLATTQNGVDIATLNYDLTVESAARASGIPVHRGVEHWLPGTPMKFASEVGHVNLFKLHGSIDWEHVSAERPRDEWYREHGRRSTYPLVSGRTVRVSETGAVDRPAIILGDREKLNGEGPTLALIAAFERALSAADHLVIVGYSFADVHVNAMVRSWANADNHRTLTVIDPRWPKRYDLDGFRHHLLDALRPKRETSQGEQARMEVLRESTKDCLSQALGGLSARPSMPLSLSLIPTSSGVELHVHNNFTAVRSVRLRAPEPTMKKPVIPRTEIGDDGSFPGRGTFHDVGKIGAGEVRVTGILSDAPAESEIIVGVHAADHQDEWDYDVALTWPGLPDADRTEEP